jgi:tetratricopeptide (TPR) repeat protein
MSSFQFNSKLNSDSLSQYRAFLTENRRDGISKEALISICKSIEQETRRQTQNAQATLSSPFTKAAREMYQVAQIMTGSFLGGVMLALGVAKQLETANAEQTAHLATMLDWGNWLPLDQSVVRQLLEDDVQMLIRVDSNEQSWIERLEQAFQLYSAGNRLDDSFQQSLHILLNLASASKHDYGNYAVMQRIGMLYLYHPDLLDLPRAEMMFINAAQAVQREQNLQMKRLLSTLTMQGSNGMIQDFDSLKNRMASEYYFQAGVSCYVRGNYERAVEYFETAYYIRATPELTYLLAKSLLCAGRIGDSVRIMNPLLKKFEFYMLKCSLDAGFAGSPKVLEMLSMLREILLSEVRVKMQEIRASIVEESQALQLLENIDKRAKERSCYSILQAHNEIEQPRRWLLTPRVFEAKLVMMEHTLRVNSLQFSHDSKLLATSSWKVILNEVESGAERQTFTGLKSKETVNALSFSPDNRILAAAGSEKRVLIWEIDSGNLIRVLEGHSQSISSLAFSPNNKFIASAGVDRYIMIWNTFTGDLVFRLEGHKNSISKVAFSPDSQLLASASLDNSVILWDMKSGKKLLSLDRHAHAVTSVQFSADGKRLATSSWDKTVKLWDIVSSSELRTFSGHQNGVDSVMFILQDKTLASTSFNRISKVCCIKLWDLNSGREIESSYGRFYSAVFSPDASKLAVASSDKSVKIMTAPEMTLARFVEFERNLRAEIEQLRRKESAQNRDASEIGRRSGERRKNAFWLGGVDLRTGKDRREKIEQ